MKLKLTLIITLVTPIICLSQPKSKIDSIVIQFLKTQPNTPTPILEIEKHGKYGNISRNYFWDINKESISKDTINVTNYIFGSASPHARKYFLVNVKCPRKEEYKIIDNNKIEDAISDLLKYLQPYNLSNSQKAQLINELSFSHY